MTSSLKNTLIGFSLLVLSFFIADLIRWFVGGDGKLSYKIGLWIGLIPFWAFCISQESFGTNWKEYVILGLSILVVHCTKTYYQVSGNIDIVAIPATYFLLTFLMRYCSHRGDIIKPEQR
jgi:hypothetical protein